MVEKKECTKCKQEKSLAEFIKNGLYRHPRCDDCRKQQLRNDYYRRKALKQPVF